jgi:hypothetical protein
MFVLLGRWWSLATTIVHRLRPRRDAQLIGRSRWPATVEVVDRG